MAAGRRGTSGLATRIVRVTLFIGAITIVASGTVAVVSTSRLSHQKAQGRHLVLIQQVEDRIEGRLRTAAAVMEEASTEAAKVSGSFETVSALRPLFEKNGDLFGALIVSDRRGDVIASMIAEQMTTSIKNDPVFARALAGQTGFVVHDAGSDRWELWLGRAALDAKGRPVVVLGRVQTGFMQASVRDAASDPQSVVTVLSGTHVLASSEAEGASLLGGAVWTPAGANSGSVSVVTSAGVRMGGDYNDIQGIEGISWRVVALEPMAVTTLDTLSAIAPSIVVLLLGGTVALLTAWGVSLRLVRPLKDLERAARAAAAGSYVKPITTDRDDEIRRVAEAFNAVALRLNALHDLSQLLASASRVDQVLDGILSAMGHIVGPGAAAIYLLDEEGALLEPARARGVDLAHALSVDIASDGWLARALRQTDPVALAGTPEQLAEALPGLSGPHGAAIAAPLVAGHDALGVVVVVRDEGLEISEAVREMVRTFSAQAAVAVQTSRLFEVESELRQVAEAMRAVAEELVRPEGLQEALTTVERIVGGLFASQVVQIVLIDPAKVGVTPGDERAQEVELLGAVFRALDASDKDSPVTVARGTDATIDAALDRLGAESILIAPVAVATDHGGAMLIPLTGAKPVRGAAGIARALADELALALDNAYFFDRAIARAANLETIFRISQAVGSSLQVNVVLNRVLDVVQKILSADAVALINYDPRRQSLATAMARGAIPPAVLQLDIRPGEDLPGRVFASGEPVSVRDLHEGMDGIAGTAASQDLRSLLAVPLLARGRPIGVLMVFAGQPGAFNDEDLSVLQTFASQAALAIDTARLYSREHEVASVLQRAILPEALPDFAELEAGSVYAPAGGEAEIGGDYYDLFRGSDDSIWFAIADVCGKGVQAATKTSMIKYSVRGLVAAGLPPARVVAEVNRMTAEAGDPSDIVTLWLGRLDPASLELVWANGGHPPGLVLQADGEVVPLPPTGPLLGASGDAIYDEGTVRLSAGDKIVLYTDGVTEARQGNTFFGEERVRTTIAEYISAEETAHGILSAVRDFVRAELRDDVAVLALTVRGPAVAEQEKTTKGRDGAGR